MLKLEMAFPVDMYVRQVIEYYGGLSCLVLPGSTLKKSY